MPVTPDPLRIARLAADAAGAVALRAFGRTLKVETKADHTPVTAIDRAAETTARRIIGRAFPEDGFLGEEFGDTRPGADARWIIDPIDGTKAYIRGMPIWGTLIARQERGRITTGAMALPALGHRMWARKGGGAFLDGRRVRVSRHRTIRGAYILNGDLDGFVRRGALKNLGAIARKAATIRSLGDCAAYRWVIEGRAEAMIESTVSAWDVAALEIIVEEAGGRITDWSGGKSWHANKESNVVASNGRIHDELLRLLKR